MSFDWRGFVNLAEELLQREEESYLRSSISRAYYGTFCIARNKKSDRNYRTKSGENIHQIVINAYKNSNDKNEQRIGLLLDELRRSRNDADYDENKSINKDFARRMVLSAKEILALLGIT